MKRFLAVTFGVFLFGCEKKVDFKLKERPDRLVVEATIETGQPPVVILSKSVGYFSKISADMLTQSFVHGAEVYVSNGTLTHKLKEYSRSLGNSVTFYYYSIDSSNLSTSFVGELNHSYTLRIVSQGNEYTATTTIPSLN